jgi:large subunit ribosomal protein L25
MATQVTLKAELRDTRGKGPARKLRAAGQLPAVLYGAGADPLALTLDAHDTHLLFHSISVDNTIVNLEVEGQKVPVPTLVREIQTHSIRPDVLHVDFLRIEMGVEVELEVPIHLIGTPKGVRDDGGVLEQSFHHLPIRCIPSDIPEEILADVSELEIGDSIHVRDLSVPDGVEILVEGDRMVCSVQAPTVLKSETEEEEDGDAEPEIVGEEGSDAEDSEAERIPGNSR